MGNGVARKKGNNGLLQMDNNMRYILLYLVVFGWSCRPVKNYVHLFADREDCYKKFRSIDLLELNNCFEVLMWGDFPEVGGAYLFKFRGVDGQQDLYTLDNKEEIKALADSMNNYGYSNHLSPFIGDTIRVHYIDRRHRNLRMEIMGCGEVDINMGLERSLTFYNYKKQYKLVNTMRFFEFIGFVKRE
jgi:hypothetical protein